MRENEWLRDKDTQRHRRQRHRSDAHYSRMCKSHPFPKSFNAILLSFTNIFCEIVIK